MHPSEAPLNIQNILWGGNGTIKPRVYIRAHTLTVTGVDGAGNPTFGTTYGEYIWEMTAALIGNPRISLERPKYTTTDGDGMRQTECTLELSSLNGRLAATQTNGILRREDLEQASVYVYADIGGVQTSWFQGRISGMPEERAGVTVIRATGFDWECLRQPVVYENFGVVYNGLFNSSQQAVWADQDFRPTAARIEVLGSHYCAHHGITRFDGGGRAVESIKKTGGPDIHLLQIGLKNGIKLGTYTITFRDAKNYTVAYPDGQSFAGVITSTLGYSSNVLVGDIGLRPEFWEGLDGTDAVFEISVNWSAVGNGICMAFNLIEKALRSTWGTLPTSLARMDIPAWTAAARRFESFTVHVDATNSDNSVFEQKLDNIPMTVAQLAQKILDHYGCSLRLTNLGEVSITMPYLDDVPAYPHDTTNTITGDGIRIEASDYLFNYFTAQYAQTGSSYGATTTPIDTRINPTALIVEKTISLPYFKAGIGRRFAQWAIETFVRRFMRSQVTINYNVHAGVGLLMQTGDRVTIESNVLPRLNGIVEVYKIDKECGTREESTVTAQVIQSHEGPRVVVCSTAVGEFKLW